MAYPQLTQAANNGDERAIATLIQIALTNRPQVRVTLRGQRLLELQITADYRLNQAQTLRTIGDVLGPLQLRLDTIDIVAFIQHDTVPIWQQRISHGPTYQPQRRSPIKQRQRGGIPDWLAEKPNLQTYRRLLEENFDLTRLAIVVLFVLYGIFMAKHYNVADFLSGKVQIIQFIHGANLIFHEAGHMLFMVFGRFMGILGGSLNQILIPVMISGYFFVKRQYFSGSVTLFWVGENFWDVSIYAHDARYTLLPLLGGEGTIHDWNWLLTTLGWIPYTQIVGSLLYAMGTVIYIGAIGLAIYFSQKQFSSLPR